MVAAQTKGVGGDDSLVSQVNRYGLHIRQSIVERARAQLGQAASASLAHLGVPERIPRTQAEINAQADAAIRDLFPRIPNTDRQQIIEHAFNKVGLAHCLNYDTRGKSQLTSSSMRQ